MNKALVLVCLLVLASVTIHVFGPYFLAEQTISSTSSVLNVFSSLLALLAVLLVYASVEPDETKSKVWSLLSFGFAFWVLGEVSWAVQVIFFNNPVPYPSIADLFWVLGYPFLFAGFFYRLNTLSSTQERITAINFVILSASAIFTVVLLWSLPSAFSLNAAHLDQTLNLVYAVADLALFMMAASIAFFFGAESVSLVGPELSRAWIIIALGFALHAVYDVFFGYFVSLGAYASGSAFDFLYDVAYAVIAVGAFYLSDAFSRR
jgi:hypothetical protein